MINFLGAIASLFPGYIQGRRQAIADNWQDLQNFNNIQQGQISNAFLEDTFQPRLDMAYNNARRDAMNTLVSGGNTALYFAGLPGAYYDAQIKNAYTPALSNANYSAQLQAYNQWAKNPGLLLQKMAGQNPLPSSQIGG